MRRPMVRVPREGNKPTTLAKEGVGANRIGARMRWRWVLAWTVSALLIVGLGWACLKGGVGNAANVTTVLGAASLVGGLLAWARHSSPGHGRSSPGQLADAAEVLARLVRRQWQEEATLRQLFDPAPLPVVWADCPLPRVSDHRQLVGGPVTCRADEPGELAAAFRGLPRRRLVALGPAGSGKTTLAVLLTLALLRERDAEEPVPVLLTLSSFDPSRESAPAWLRRRIAADYPALTDAASYGPSAIEDLLSEHRILPVLDGLDEMPIPAQTAVLAALNDTLDAHAPLVLTCRTTHYTTAVAEGDILVGAAVIEPAPLHATHALNLLRLASPPGPRQEQWDVVAEHLARYPQGPAAQALANPLMVALTRAVYADAPGDPSELADSRRFPDSAAIEQHLLDSLVPTLYARAHRQHPGERRWKPARAQHYLTHIATALHREGTHDFAWWQMYRTVPALTSTRWRTALWTTTAVVLTVLVGQMIRLIPGDTPTFVTTMGGVREWLVAEIPTLAAVIAIGAWLGRRVRIVRFPVVAAALTALCGSVIGCIITVFFADIAARQIISFEAVSEMLTGEAWWVFPNGLGLTVVFFLLVIFVTGLPAFPPAPSRANATLDQWRRRWPRALALICATAIAGCIISYVRASGIPDPTTSNWVRMSGLVYGPIIGVGFALLQWMKSPGGRYDLVTPSSSIQSDRLFLILGSVFAVIMPVLTIRIPYDSVGFFWQCDPDPEFPCPSPVSEAAWHIGVWLIETWALSFAVALSTSAWAHYTAARLYLGTRGRLPWRLQAFLSEAHHLGILRQVGPVYQFRHARLRDHLGSSHSRLPGPRTDSTPADSPSRG